MTLLVGSQLDLQKIPVLGLVAQASSGAPASPVNGQIWYDTATNLYMGRENGSTVQLSRTGAILSGGTAGGDLTGTYPNPTVANLAITDAKVAAANKDGVAGTPSMRTLGTGAQQATAGNDSRLSDARTPTGTASGDLAGTYPAPTIALLAVTAAKIANATITDTQVAAANKDGVAGTASMRTLGTGAQQALAGNTRLDQIAVPTASVNMNGQKLTGLADGTAATDAVTKQQLDAAQAGLDVKASVRFASTANIAGTYNATGGTSGRGQLTAMPNSAVDGVTPAVNNRVLLKNQTTPAQNGLWVITTLGTGANGVWDRATDFDADAEVTAGAFTFVEEGTTLGNSGWTLTTDNPITIGGASGTSLVWAQFTGGTTYIGTAARITVTGNVIDIDATYVGQTSITTLGTITTGTWSGTTIALNKGGTGATTAAGARTALVAVTWFSGTTPALSAGVEGTVTHNLNSTAVVASFRDATTDQPWLVAYRPTGVNTIGVTADVALGAAALKVEVHAGS